MKTGEMMGRERRIKKNTEGVRRVVGGMDSHWKKSKNAGGFTEDDSGYDQW